MKFIKPDFKYESLLEEYFLDFEKGKYVESAHQHIQNALDWEKGINLKEGHVPEKQFWLIDNNKIVAIGRIRLKLNEFLRNEGGNIGGEVALSARKKGYGRELVRLLLHTAKELEISPIICTCNVDNVASRKIIESFPHEFEAKLYSEQIGATILRYKMIL